MNMASYWVDAPCSLVEAYWLSEVPAASTISSYHPGGGGGGDKDACRLLPDYKA
jgi:hypothetical protein